MNNDLLAGVGLTRLTVYHQRAAPDGILSGCAHVHACTDEGYYAVSGSGAIELNDMQNGFRSVPLNPGDYVQFPPQTLHRSVSHGDLVVLVLMGNAGLAEHGDARMYFGAAVDADPVEYARLVALPRHHGLEGALERRDASVRAYMRLMDWWQTDRPAYFTELKRFLALHQATLAPRRAEFARIIDDGPGRWLADARQAVENLGVTHPDTSTTSTAHAVRTTPPDATQALGMCGLLEQFLTSKPA